MLKITKNEFEIEETIQITHNENDNEVVDYEFKMQLTADDMGKLQNGLFEKDNKIDDEELGAICFKEHNTEFKEKVGAYKYNEMLDQVKGYLMGFFIEKKRKPYNSLLTDLTSLTNNLTNLK